MTGPCLALIVIAVAFCVGCLLCGHHDKGAPNGG